MLVTKKITEREADENLIKFPEHLCEGGLREVLTHIRRSPHGLKVDGSFHGRFSFSDLGDTVDQYEVHGTIRDPENSASVYFAISEDDLGPRRNGIRFSRIRFVQPPRYESGGKGPSEDEEGIYRLVRAKVDDYFEKRRLAKSNPAA